jgi:hypothetical protein
MIESNALVTFFRKDDLDITTGDIDFINSLLEEYRQHRTAEESMDFSYLYIQAFSDRCSGVSILLDDYDIPLAIDFTDDDLIDLLSFDDEFILTLFHFLKTRAGDDYTLLMHYACIE